MRKEKIIKFRRKLVVILMSLVIVCFLNFPLVYGISQVVDSGGRVDQQTSMIGLARWTRSSSCSFSFRGLNQSQFIQKLRSYCGVFIQGSSSNGIMFNKAIQVDFNYTITNPTGSDGHFSFSLIIPPKGIVKVNTIPSAIKGTVTIKAVSK